MQELVTFVAKSLVDHPDQVVVHETEGPEAIILELNVAPEDMGKVIGKQGRIAKADSRRGQGRHRQEQQARFCGNSVTLSGRNLPAAFEPLLFYILFECCKKWLTFC